MGDGSSRRRGQLENGIWEKASGRWHQGEGMWGKRLGGNIWADREKVFGRVCRSSGKFGSRGQYAVAMMLLRNPLQMKEPSGKCIRGIGEKGRGALASLGKSCNLLQIATRRLRWWRVL